MPVPTNISCLVRLSNVEFFVPTNSIGTSLHFTDFNFKLGHVTVLVTWYHLRHSRKKDKREVYPGFFTDHIPEVLGSIKCEWAMFCSAIVAAQSCGSSLVRLWNETYSWHLRNSGKLFSGSGGES